MIYIDNVSKSFRRYTIPINSLKSFILHYHKYKSENNKIQRLNVIQDLTLHIKQSEILCIVGNNGAGKSTLAKLITGTSKPTKGKISVNGRIVPFLELGVAFSNELTGRDNVYMNGVLLGLSLKYIRNHMEDIFRYAEIEEFIDTPLKYYSSGMQMRLAFSVGMHADGDIYIFDEILAVGDANFQKKCSDSFQNLLNKGKTIILITHDLNTVKKYATKILLLSSGKYKIIDDWKMIQALSEEELMLCT